MTSRKRTACWLAASAVAIVILLLSLPLVVDSDILKAKLQSTIKRQTGVQVHFQQIQLSFLPRLSITLHQIELDLPEQIQGTIGTIQVYPEISALLTGRLRLARLVLDSPEVSLQLYGDVTKEEQQASPYSFTSLNSILEKGLDPLLKTAPELSLLINHGSLTLNKGREPISAVKDLKLQMELASTNSGISQLKLQGSTSLLTFRHNDQNIIVEGLGLKARAQKDQKKLSFSIDDLTLIKPALKLGGELLIASESPSFKLDLHGMAIDVDAVRKTILAVTGNSSPGREIFSYLRGGTIPQISFHSQAETASELGDLKNIRIKGQLQSGAISIPAIELDLTDVNGDVLVSEGVLQGARVSTNLDRSTGRDGILKVALSEASDLFSLELFLNADLPQAQNLLKRIVGDSSFGQELDKITNLKGTATGKLVLGDSLDDINVQVDLTDLNLSADYQGLPFPVAITSAQVAFTESSLGLKNVHGSIGKSAFKGVSANINWTNALYLDTSSGQFNLALDELYPWMASLDGTKEPLNEISQLSGRLDLSSLRFKGVVDKPETWEFATTGVVKELTLETPRFPAEINLARGHFILNTEKLVFHDLKANSLDADLVLNGSFKGLHRGLDQVEISLDGSMGHDSAAWIQDALDVPESYAMQTPLLLSNAQLTWQSDTTASFKGNVAIEAGPELALNLVSSPERLQVKRLTIIDQHSDVEMAFDYSPDELSLNFIGNLHHETLQKLFVEQPFGKGQLNGSFGAIIPFTKQPAVIANGHLQGQDLWLPLPSGDKITIDRFSLIADGPQAKVDLSTLSWDNFDWSQVKATIDFVPGRTDVNIIEAKICEIDSTGLITIAGKNLTLDLTLDGKELDVANSYLCLSGGRVKMTGALNFSSKLTAQGEAGELSANLRGPIEMEFTNGLVEQHKILARTLEVLNVTEIVKGRLPKLDGKGFAYSSITMHGEFQGEKLFVNYFLMDGETLDALGQGELDFGEQMIAAEFLVSPFKTLDTVVKYIPGVNYLLAGNLVSIPVSIKGSRANPRIRIMSVSSVGSSLLNLGERIIKSPIKLIETITPAKGDGQE